MLQGAISCEQAKGLCLKRGALIQSHQKLVAYSKLRSSQKELALQQGASRVAVLARAVSAPPVSKSVYVFGPGNSEGDQTMKTLLGGKGANLAEMCKIGLSVPPGFTITTETCRAFHEAGAKLPAGCWEEVQAGLSEVESMIGKKMGDSADPLLVSVRSGAAISMPGMMDTVLNLGLNDEVVEGLAAKAGKRFAYDAYRRFLDMFGDVVMGVPHKLFEAKLRGLKQKLNVQEDTDLSAEDLQVLVQEYKQVYKDQGIAFPEDPLVQLENAIYAVFNSWESEKAILYREYNQITGLAGTAVNVQCMAYGNLGDTSGTGVCFTRNPSTGERLLYGEYLINAQGEDVVAGIRTPLPISQLKDSLPEAYDQLIKNCDILETHYKNMQDIEFTVQEGQLFMLQCRSGKRTGLAAIRIAVEMVDEGLIDVTQAIQLVEATHLDQLLHPQFEDEEAYQDFVLGTGLPASPGAAVGRVVFDAETAEERKNAGEKVILVRKETSPEDVKGMYSAQGVLCQLGGMTSHAAVVARGWGKTCITGVPGLEVDEDNKVATLDGFSFTEGDFLSLNGTTGEIIKGQQPLKPPTMSGNLGKFMAWVDEHRKLGVLTNADTPEDAATARENGAEGIGLTRTEHMFFKTEDRIKAVRKMILAPDVEGRKEALVEIEKFQQEDFEGIFKAMDGLPVTIRLLDPPLHEFLPDVDDEETIAEIAGETGLSTEYIETTIDNLQEVNPMLGFRGCRLTITFPEIGASQVRAIIQAAVAQTKAGVIVRPDIMIPLIGTTAELELSEKMARATAQSVMDDAGVTVEYKVGTMIEIPRAALLADKIAETAEFFSFGTNDLTQMTFGYSRDDIGKFIKGYLDKKILPYDPFIVLDQEGVGKLIEYAVKMGRKTRPNLKVGLCGEQGGEPITVKFLHGLGLDYVSCSPFRVPIARLAAAQAAVTSK